MALQCLSHKLWPYFISICWTMKHCTGCNETKSLTDFYWRQDESRFSSPCKLCTIRKADAHAKANRARRAVAHKKRLAAKPDHMKEHKLKWRYGLNKGDYDKLLASQDFKCAICGTDETYLTPRGKPQRFHVDHCHGTKKVRGILCFTCNTGLGGFRDDPNLLKAAAKYLKQFQ